MRNAKKIKLGKGIKRARDEGCNFKWDVQGRLHCGHDILINTEGSEGVSLGAIQKNR